MGLTMHQRQQQEAISDFTDSQPMLPLDSTAGYSYMPLQYVHDIVTQEFVNVGVVLWSRELNFTEGMFHPDSTRVQLMFPTLVLSEFTSLILRVQASVNPLFPEPGSIKGDGSLQWGQIGGGLTSDPKKTLEELFERFVLRHELRVTH